MIQVYSPSSFPRRPAKVGKTVEKWVLYLVVLGIAGICLYWFIIGKGKTFDVTLASIKGSVEYRNNQNEGWKTVNSVPMKLSPSIELRTLADSEAKITISDGSKVDLGSYSRIVLSKNQGEIDWVQTDGVSHHQTSKNPDRKKYLVSISDGDIEAQGTAFEVKIKETDTSILVLKDQVKAYYKDKSTAEAGAGQEILINPVGRKVTDINKEELTDDWTLNNIKDDLKNNLSIDPAVLAKAGIEGGSIESAQTTAGGDEAAQGTGDQAENSNSNTTIAPSQETQPINVNLQAKQNSNGVLLSWSGNAGDIESWKVIKGTGSELTYPSDSYRTVPKDESSYLWEMSGDGSTYYFRLCAYKANSCIGYSNAASISLSASSSQNSSNDTSNTSTSSDNSSSSSNQSAPSDSKTGSTSRKNCENSGGHWTKDTGVCKCPPSEHFDSSVKRCKKK